MGVGFEDLAVYQKARNFCKRVCRLMHQLPEDEKFNLVTPMRRAALRLTHNVAEGYGSRSYRHHISDLDRSRTSVNELIDDLNCREAENDFKLEHLQDMKAHAESVAKWIKGGIAYLRKPIYNASRHAPG